MLMPQMIGDKDPLSAPNPPPPPKEIPPVILRPQLERRCTIPNVGMQDVIDIMDYFGFDIQFALVRRDPK